MLPLVALLLAAPVGDIQKAVGEAGLDGWLFYDFRGSDPIAWRVLGLDRSAARTRRWYYLVPARGEPKKLVHAIEPHMLDALPGEARIYASWRSREQELRAMLRGMRKVAMQYSPKGDIPYVANVDAGTLELVRSLGTQVVSSADLVQRFEAVLTPEEIEGQRKAATALSRLVDETFAEIGRRLAHGPVTEFEAQQHLLALYRREGLWWDEPPNVSADAHAADPHYEVPEKGSAEIHAGSVVLIDAWAAPREGGVFGDLTKVASVGQPTAEVNAVWTLVTNARDAALQLLRDRLAAHKPVTGAELDQAARAVIAKAGFGERFIHRTGHSIGRNVHGNGAHLDDFETHDTRRILTNTCFSIEPGVYLPGQFGIRSEIDVCVVGREAQVTTGEPQRELILVR